MQSEESTVPCDADGELNAVHHPQREDTKGHNGIVVKVGIVTISLRPIIILSDFSDNCRAQSDSSNGKTVKGIASPDEMRKR